mgnify:FL=1
MRDTLLFAHIIIGLALIALPIIIIMYLNKKSSLTKPLSFVAALLSWVLLYPAGKLYLTFYPATKSVINAGSWPWVHGIVMETKEHWGLLLPIIATVAAWLVFSNKEKESRKWWTLLWILSALIGIMGRLIKIGALK